VTVLRWLRSWLSAVLWSFPLVGAVGLLEAILQWLRFGPPSDWGFSPGPVRLLAPPLTFYGWFGVAAALLLGPFAAALVVVLKRPPSLAWRITVAGALAALGVVYANYILFQHILGPEHGSIHPLWLSTLVMVLVWALVSAVLWRPVRAFRAFLSERSGAHLIVPIVILIVATSLWPDWRQEKRMLRTGRLERAVAAADLQPDAPHVLLLSIDTFRFDRLSLVNPQAPPTPHLNELAREGILYTNGLAPSPWTLPSLASVMSGLPPRVLQVEQYRPLPPDVTTLPQIAWRQGYRTAAFLTNAYLAEWYGFSEGFDFYEHASVLETLLPACRSVLAREALRRAQMDLGTASAAAVVSKVPWAVAWLRRQTAVDPWRWAWNRLFHPGLPFAGEEDGADARQQSGERFFLWIHLLDPHLPYVWRELPGRAESQLGPGVAPQRSAIPPGPHFAGGVFKGLKEIRSGEWVPDPQEEAGIRALYDREIEYVDSWVGRLITDLKALGLWRNMLVVFLADHGEELFEHGGFEHGHSVMPEVVRVPLILRLPRGEAGGQVIDEPTSIANVLPTLCGILGWPIPPGVTGRPFWPPRGSGRSGVQPSSVASSSLIASGPAPADSSLMVIENLLYGPQQEGILTWPAYGVRLAGADTATWFDLAADPLALHPLPSPPFARRTLALADSMQASWDQLAAEHAVPTAAGEQHIPADLHRRMRALGYVQ
jgi:arylsulfatase A-like enzyme